MKLVVQVKLLPTPEQAAALTDTLRQVTTAADHVSAVAFARFGLRARELPLRRLCHGDLKAGGLGAQAAQHVIKRVVDAYTALRAGIRSGGLGGPGSKRYREVVEEKGAWLVGMGVMPDHVQLLVEVDPQFGVHRLVKAIKGRSSRVLREESLQMKSRLPTLWTNSCFVSTVGGAPPTAVKRYVEQQKGR